MIGRPDTGILKYGTVVLAALLLLGCASKPQPPAAGEGEAVVAPAPTSSAGIMALGGDLRAHPRAVFSSSSAKYGYFIGGVLNAEYDPVSRVLSVASQAADPAVTCKYAADGALFIDPSEKAAAKRAACDDLILKLHESLVR